MTIIGDGVSHPARPLYRQIADELRADITSGRLAAGARLPPQRDLAYRRGVTLSTISHAYAELNRDGWIEATVGRGSFVRGPIASVDEAGEIDLRANTPPLRHLVSDLLAALGRDIRSLSDALIEPPFHAAGHPHREAGSAWLERHHGVDSENRVLLFSNGGQSALLCTLLSLCKHGDVVATEAFTYVGVRLLAPMLGLRVVGLEMDRDGMSAKAFQTLCETDKPKLVFCTPNYHSPTTAVMSDARRRRIAALAQKHGVTIVEDDVYGAYTGQTLPPLAALAPRSTVLFTSFSKLLAPGLRVGLISAPQDLAGGINEKIRVSGAGPDVIAWEVIARWITDGTLAAVLETHKAEMGARYHMAQAVLAAFRPQGHPFCPHLWLPLPPVWSSPSEFVLRARENGVHILGSDMFATEQEAGTKAAIRISLISAPARGRLETALERLRELLTAPQLQPVIA